MKSARRASLVVGVAAIVIGLALHATRNWPKPPPGYQLQTDGHNWRFIGIERQSGFFTNENNDGTRSGCVKEAWKIHRANDHQHSEWKDHE
jgi:hypothetical protein